MTWSINTILQYRITSTQSLEFTAGAPVIAPKARPDGLSELVLGLEYEISF